MGYYTEYSLDIDNVDEAWVLIYLLRERYREAAYALQEDGTTADSCKWYGHEKDMRSFSAHHPQAVFSLSGVGEEYPDIWVEYYRNGKMQRCEAKISFDSFDNTKLT